MGLQGDDGVQVANGSFEGYCEGDIICLGFQIGLGGERQVFLWIGLGNMEVWVEIIQYMLKVVFFF